MGKAARGVTKPSWNALTSEWMECVSPRAKFSRVSPLEAIAKANGIHQLVGPNPLDVFAAHRFLLTLIYWIAEDAKAVSAIRTRLLQHDVPTQLVKELKNAEAKFSVFDSKAPFLQDPKVVKAKRSSAAYLFADMASGTNVAHFHHGDDKTSRLCLCCATQGLMRLVPWMQSGGAGLSPAVHGAPPMMPLAIGSNLCETLGLNLIPMNIAHGVPRWSGHFRPAGLRVKVMEGLTWNARRIHLLEPNAPGECSRCGEKSLPTVGPIVFEKNDACRAHAKRVWRDPAAFYSLKNGLPFTTAKSGRESVAALGGDVQNLFQRTFGKKIAMAPSSLVVEANPTHKRWMVVIPCTDGKSKTYDHRAVWLDGFSGAPPPTDRGWPEGFPVEVGDRLPEALRVQRTPGCLAFVRAASLLTAADWGVLRGARSMEDDPAAFDVFTAVYWPLRDKYPSLPRRRAAWLAIKLMACSGRLRPKGISRDQALQPWRDLPRQQLGREGARRYPRSIPGGDRLETELRRVIGRYVSSKSAAEIDWPGMCQFLNDVLL